MAILFTTLPIQAVVKYANDNEADQNDDRKNIQEAQIHLTTPTSSINNQLSYYAGKKKRRQADGVLFFFNIYLFAFFRSRRKCKKPNTISPAETKTVAQFKRIVIIKVLLFCYLGIALGHI